jgi:hypothetical protein
MRIIMTGSTKYADWTIARPNYSLKRSGRFLYWLWRGGVFGKAPLRFCMLFYRLGAFFLGVYAALESAIKLADFSERMDALDEERGIAPPS